MNKYLRFVLERSKVSRQLLHFLNPANIDVNEIILKSSFLKDYILSFYPKKSLELKLFYNIGAGNQRSEYKFWSYVDLRSSKYDKRGIDIFYDLESLCPLPIVSDHAEVVFNSFVIEHISKEATRNLCNEAYRILKEGGVFHSKVHSYDYGYKLFGKGIISPNVPFGCRESREQVIKLILRNRGRVRSFFTSEGEYVIEGNGTKADKLVFSAADAFLAHNATTAYQYFMEKGMNSQEMLDSLSCDSVDEFYREIKEKFVHQSKKEPHQHNADYWDQNELLEYIKSVGFSEVYFTSPYQSVSPALWEDRLNKTHNGFCFAIEAVK